MHWRFIERDACIENATAERFQYTTDRPSLCKALIRIGFFSAIEA